MNYFKLSKSVALAAVAFCFLCPATLAQTTQPAQSGQEIPPIRNFLKVSDQFCTGGQPRLEHLAKLKADGVKAIINLRQPSEHRAPEEEAEAKKLGLRYFNIPVVYA